MKTLTSREITYWILFFFACFAAGYTTAMRPELKQYFLKQNKDFYILSTTADFLSEEVIESINAEADLNIHLIVEKNWETFQGRFLDNQKFNLAFLGLPEMSALKKQNLLKLLPEFWSASHWSTPDFVSQNYEKYFLPLFWFQQIPFTDPESGQVKWFSHVAHPMLKSAENSKVAEAKKTIKIFGIVLPQYSKDLDLTHKFLTHYLSPANVIKSTLQKPWASTLILSSQYKIPAEQTAPFIRSLHLYQSQLQLKLEK